MIADITQEGLQDGYAYVVLEMEDGDEPYAPGDSIAIGITGAGGTEYISRDDGKKWVGAPQPLKLGKEPQVEGGRVTFWLPPFYVDSLSPDSGDGINCDILLVDGNGTVKNSTVQWVEVIPSGLPDVGILKDYRDAEADDARAADEELRRQAEEEEARKAAEAAAKAEAEAKAREDAEKAAAVIREQEEAEAKAREEEARKAAEEEEKAQAAIREREEAEKKAQEAAISERQTDMRREEADAQILLAQAEMNPPAKKSRGMLIAGIAILILALAGGGYFYWQKQNAAQQAELARKAEEEAAAAKAEAAKAEAARAARADAKGRVGAFFAGQRDPAKAMELAKELDADTPEQQDAIFRLYYYAAENDNPEGALSYARCIDPSQPAWGTVKKDGAEAWYYYGKTPQGQAARDELKKWTQNAAASGNADARSWLNSME